jgi:restriction endonuclease S subunit
MDIDKSSWEKVKLGDFVSHSTESIDPNNGEISRYVAGEHMDTDDLLISRWGDIGDGYLGPAFIRRFHPRDVLYGSRRTYLRKLSVADFDGVCSNTTLVLRTSNSLKLVQEILPFLITTEKFHEYSVKESKGSVNPYVNWSDLAKYEFRLPPLEVQTQLSVLFWEFEKHKRNLMTRIDSLRELQNVWVLTKWNEFQDFDSKHLKEVISMEYGKSLTSSSRIPGAYPVVGSTGIVGTHEKCLVEGPVIIIGRKGNAGNVFMIDEDCFPIDTAYYVNLLTTEVSIDYIFEALKLLGLPNLQESTAIPGLNRNRVYDLTVPIPPTDVQEQFCLEIATIQKTISLISDEMVKLDLLRKNLLNQFLGGAN